MGYIAHHIVLMVFDNRRTTRSTAWSISQPTIEARVQHILYHCPIRTCSCMLAAAQSCTRTSNASLLATVPATRVPNASKAGCAPSAVRRGYSHSRKQEHTSRAIADASTLEGSEYGDIRGIVHAHDGAIGCVMKRLWRIRVQKLTRLDA